MTQDKNTVEEDDKQKKEKKSRIYRLFEWMARPAKKLRVNRQILVVAYVFAFLFLALMGYMVYYVGVKSQDDIVSSYNPRKNLFRDKVIKGDLETADGKVIAKSIKTGEDYVRQYPYDNLFAHIGGYDIYGKSGLESSANYYMYTSNANLLERAVKNLKNEKNRGDTAVSTIRYDLQKAAYDALGNRKGAVVVMEPSTGKVLAMVSKPDFNPNYLEQNWKQLLKDEDSTMLNRATQGLYPPGSTFKIITALEYIRENKNWKKFQYQCSGTTVVDDISIRCAGKTAHGKENLYQAMADSCNCAFVTLASGLNCGSFRKTAETML